MRDLTAYTNQLSLDEDGVWRSESDRQVSYPESGHGACFEVEDRSFWFRHRNRCITTLVKRFPPPDNGMILDVGGGNGVVSAALSTSGFDVALLEPGPQGVKNARQRGVPTILNTTFEAAKFQPGSLPAVGLFDVIEHIEDDQRFLNSVHQSLRPGGRLYATVPAHDWLWSAEDIEAGHFRRYTRDTIIKVMSAGGFEIDFTSYLFWPLPLPMWVIRCLPYRLGRMKPRLEQEKIVQDHGSGTGLTSKVMEALLKPEARRIEAGKTMAVGTSCIVVATRRD